MKQFFIVFILSLFSLISCTSSITTDFDVIIPRPVAMTPQSGSFTLNSSTKVLFENIDESEQAILLSQLKDTRSTLEETNSLQGPNVIKLVLNSSEGVEGAYQLTISSKGIEIEAGSRVGIFYGVQSLRQLIEANGDELQAVEISDSPRFQYRGFMLDVSRHFRSKEFVMRQLDAIAHYKLNRFHFHLTDGAGWRLEIKKYPKLTEVAAFRPIRDYQSWINAGKPFCTQDAPNAYGGYYTHEDIREIVAYAAERHITVIPEIEMPGHSEEVLSVYPELSCSGKAGVNSEFCVGNEETFTFLENVLTEVMTLFPSQIIHIGGDEANKMPWSRCPKCKKRMQQESLTNVDELQSYMIHRMEKFLNKNNKTLLGWDEILEGGLTPNAIVMSWRGEAGGIAAAKMGNKVIMTPNSHCYFDGYQDAPSTQPVAMSGFLPLDKVYSYNPIPESLASSPDLILGVQANLWEEWIVKDAHAEMMIYPRLLAIAEVGWTPLERKDITSFRKRVVLANKELAKRGINSFDITKEVGDREESREVIEHIALNKPVSYKYLYHPKYTASAERALTDGRRGNWSYSDEVWQGFLESDIDVTIDMGEITDIKEIKATFLQEFHAWIWMPKEINISISEDNKAFTLLEKIEPNFPVDKTGYFLEDYGWKGETKARYIRYHAKASGRAGGWLFTDEIVVN